MFSPGPWMDLRRPRPWKKHGTSRGLPCVCVAMSCPGCLCGEVATASVCLCLCPCGFLYVCLCVRVSLCRCAWRCRCMLPSFLIPFRTRDGCLPHSSCSRSPFLALFFSLFVYTYINIYVYICIKAFPSRRGRCRGYESAPSPDARAARQLDKHPDASLASLGSGDTPGPRERGTPPSIVREGPPPSKGGSGDVHILKF